MEYTVIELAADEAVIARFRQQRGGLTFLGATRRSLDAAGALEEFAREFAHQATPGSRTVLALPPSLLSFRELEIPITDRRKLREIIPLELKGETALPTEELLFDSVPLPGGRIMAVWCRRQAVSDLIDSCTRAGLEPQIVTASPFCWGGLVPPHEPGFSAVADGSALVVYRDGQPIFFRALDTRDAAADLQRSAAALALGREIKLDRIYRHGPHIPEQSDGAGIPVVPLPLEPAAVAPFESETAARDLAGCRAIASSCVAGIPVNFRYGALAHTAENVRQRKLLRIAAILSILLVVALFAQAGLRYYLVSRDLKSLNSSIMLIYHDLFPNRKNSADPVTEVKAELRQMGGASAAQDVLRTLKGVAEAKGDDITGLYEATLDGGQVILRGDARSIQAVNGFRGRLAATFATVEVGEQKSKPDGTVSFTIRGALKEGEK